MPKFAANLSMLWPELDMYERFAAAANAGFSRIEILFVHLLDLDRVERLLKDNHLELVLFDPAPGDWEAGERGMAVNAARREAFQRSVREALQIAQRLGVQRLNVLTGIPAQGVTEEVARKNIIQSFIWAAAEAEPTGVKLLLENLNTTDFPGIYLNTVERAADIVQAVDKPNVRVQFDQYHVGMMGGDAPSLIRQYANVVEHVQIADVPGRHEPGTGQQPIRQFLSDLDAVGYQGAVGLEYRPSGPTDDALAWLARDQRG
jgi:hydroxypyruvate isomerase